jgi:two-component system, cell cycle sensor histidine kinase and response regulator CckA
MNLAINARDAMPRGGKLTIETGSAELDRAYVADHPDAALGLNAVLAVTDNGTGIDEETLSHIFEPFFTTKPAGVGTGLGLSTVYGIVKQSGGSIWVYSEPGHGTTFKIHLPAVDATPTVEAANGHPETLPIGDETILLVEDEEAVRELVASVLRERGYTVLVADNAGHALDLLREAEPALLLTDLVMPQMSGGELAERAREQHPTIRVLFMSGYAGEAVVRNGHIRDTIDTEVPAR